MKIINRTRYPTEILKQAVIDARPDPRLSRWITITFVYNQDNCDAVEGTTYRQGDIVIRLPPKANAKRAYPVRYSSESRKGYIASSHQNLYSDMVFTIAHELRHTQQFASPNITPALLPISLEENRARYLQRTGQYATNQEIEHDAEMDATYKWNTWNSKTQPNGYMQGFFERYFRNRKRYR